MGRHSRFLAGHGADGWSRGEGLYAGESLVDAVIGEGEGEADVAFALLAVSGAGGDYDGHLVDELEVPGFELGGLHDPAAC